MKADTNMSETKPPLLSVIVPTYNADTIITTCLNSILRQTFTDFEVLIIDGLSTDNTLNTVRRYNDDRIKIFSEKDAGIYDAMNKGIKLAAGQWLYFLGSDDELNDDNVFRKIFIDHAAVVEKSDYLYANVLWGTAETIYSGRYDIYELYEQNICHQAMLVKKQVFSTVGLFNLKYQVVADWEFNIRCFFSSKVRVNYLNIVVAKYSLLGTSANTRDDIFTAEKDKLFFNWLPQAPWHKQVKFKALYLKSNTLAGKMAVFFYNLLYRLSVAGRVLLTGKTG